MKDDPTTLQARHDALIEKLADERVNMAAVLGGIESAARGLRMICYTLWAMAPDDSPMKADCFAAHQSVVSLVNFVTQNTGALQERLRAELPPEGEAEAQQILH